MLTCPIQYIYVSAPAYLMFCVFRFLRVSCRYMSRVVCVSSSCVSFLLCFLSCVSHVLRVSCHLCLLSFMFPALCVSWLVSFRVLCVFVLCVSCPHFLYLVSLRFVCLVSNIPGTIQYVLCTIDVSRVSTPGVSIGFWVFSVNFFF